MNLSGLLNLLKPLTSFQEILKEHNSAPQKLYAATRAFVVAGAATDRCAPIGLAAVERQKFGLPVVELSGHLDLLKVDGEVDDRTRLEHQQWFTGGSAVFLILMNGIGDILSGMVGLELECRHGNAVNEQHEVDLVTVLG